MAAHRRLLVPARGHADRCVLADWQAAERHLGAGPRRRTVPRAWLIGGAPGAGKRVAVVVCDPRPRKGLPAPLSLALPPLKSYIDGMVCVLRGAAGRLTRLLPSSIRVS